MTETVEGAVSTPRHAMSGICAVRFICHTNSVSFPAQTSLKAKKRCIQWTRCRRQLRAVDSQQTAAWVCVIAQVFRYWLLTAEPQVQSWVTSCDTYDRKTGTRVGFGPSSHTNHHSTIAPEILDQTVDYHIFVP